MEAVVILFDGVGADVVDVSVSIAVRSAAKTRWRVFLFEDLVQ